MANTERLLDEETGSEPLARVFYGEGDTPELWKRVGMRLPDANIISGGERDYGNLRPILENGVTVVLQQGNKNALVLRGAVEEEDHLSLSSVAHEASEKRGKIPEMPEVRGIAWNEDIQSKARRDWQASYDSLVQRSASVRSAVENSGAWLVLDSKEDLKGFDVAENEWRKDVLDARLQILDDEFGKEVKKLRNGFVDGWQGVGKVDGGLPSNGLAARVLTGVAMASALPFNPALHVDNVPAIEQPADGDVVIILSQNEDLQSRQPAEHSSKPDKSLSRGVDAALDFYDNYVDNMIPDTPQDKIDAAKGVLEIDSSEEIDGGYSALAKHAYDAVLERGGSENDAIFAVKAAGMGFFQNQDGSKWFHVYGRGDAQVEEVSRDQVEKNTTVRAIASALAEAYESGDWGGSEPVGGNPVTVPSQVPTNEAPNTPEALTPYTGNIGFGSDNIESDFLAVHTEYNADNTTPISIEVSGKTFNLIETGDRKYFINVTGEWKELIETEQLIGDKNFIVLQYFSKPPQAGDMPEAVLWYPAFTEDQWKNMTPEEKAQPWVAFAPPTEMENEIPGYSRDDDGGIALNITSGDNVPTFLVSLELKNTSFTEPSKDATQIPPSEVVTPTPPLPTEDVAPTPEVKQYAICNSENWRNCEIPLSDLRPGGDYIKWLDQNWNPSLPEPDPNKQTLLLQSNGALLFLSPDKQHAIPTTDRSYTSGFTYGYTKCGVTWGGVSHEMTCPVVPIALSVPGRPGETVKIIGVIEQGYNQPDSDITSIFNAINGNEALMLGGYEKDETGKSVLGGGDSMDFMQQYVLANPDLMDRLQKFQETNDPTWISGVVFKVFTLH